MYWVYFRNVIITREMRRTPLSWEGSTFSQPLWKPTRDATEIPQTEAQKRMRPQVATGSQAEMSFLIVCNKLAFCILNKWLKMFAHQKTNRCSISFSALHLKKKKKGECFASIQAMARWHNHYHACSSKEGSGAFGSSRSLDPRSSFIYSLCPEIIIHSGCEAMSPALIPTSTGSCSVLLPLCLPLLVFPVKSQKWLMGNYHFEL